MDNYSQTIMNAVEKVKSAVVKIDRVGNRNNKMVSEGSGSGFIISSDGFLFINSHVVNKAKAIKVALHDGTIATTKSLVIASVRFQ